MTEIQRESLRRRYIAAYEKYVKARKAFRQARNTMKTLGAALDAEPDTLCEAIKGVSDAPE